MADPLRLGLRLPPECVPGVVQNLRLLEQHWETLRGFAPEPEVP